MKATIPLGPSGFPTLSANSLRRYGAGGIYADVMETPRGCPRAWFEMYVNGAPKGEDSYELIYGRVVHQALQWMEEHACGPEEAIREVWDIRLGPDAMAEMLDDLRKFLERPSSPMDRYLLLASEKHLDAELYVDDDFGPIHYQGIVDAIRLDYGASHLIHVSDWKSNRQPSSVEDVKADIQGKGYAWLVLQNWRDLIPVDQAVVPRVVFHLDLIKFGELPGVLWSEDDLEAWQEWAIAVAKHMLRDTKHEPEINPGCARCPVSATCPAYEALPDISDQLLAIETGRRTPEWRDRANNARLLLAKAVDQWDADIAAQVKTYGPVTIGRDQWVPKLNLRQQQDTRRMHELVGDPFYDLVSTTKGALTQYAKGLPEPTRSNVLGCIVDVPNGLGKPRRITAKED